MVAGGGSGPEGAVFKRRRRGDVARLGVLTLAAFPGNDEINTDCRPGTARH